MIRVVIESPLSGADFANRWMRRLHIKWPALWRWFERRGRQLNQRYAMACARDSLQRGEAPYASHLFFDRPGLLDDGDERERVVGMSAGFAWGDAAQLRVVYTDWGVSGGMIQGIKRARTMGQAVQFRAVGGVWHGKRSYDYCTLPADLLSSAPSRDVH